MTTIIAWAVAALAAIGALLFGGAVIQRKRTARQQGDREDAVQASLAAHKKELKDALDNIGRLDGDARRDAIWDASEKALVQEWPRGRGP